MATALKEQLQVPETEIRTPLTQTPEQPADLQLPGNEGKVTELEGYLDKIERTPTAQVVTDDQTGQPVLHPSGGTLTADDIKFTPETAKEARKLSIENARRWLVVFLERSGLMKLLKNRKPVEE